LSTSLILKESYVQLLFPLCKFVAQIIHVKMSQFPIKLQIDPTSEI